VLVGIVIGVGGVVLLADGGTGADAAGGLIIAVGVTVALGGAIFGGATRGVFGVALFRYLAEGRTTGPFMTADLDGAARSR
jgi:hypothetical protein